ncbi:hypothetical protein ASG72_04075 [Bosea sp. Leaf344]|uniref:fatty acyl-AMP ligase n=1 Tax=Bosea sp. Leaf344 TaxID=1736346 RepID=UPI0006F24A1A|nr:fatty acyl-AMP ligase [Bosea sp. Leaf344]KQU54798.1 hypothetical protein ASG72_04075 [Bosea sp. Leaf344]
MQGFLSLPEIVQRHATARPDAYAVIMDAGPTAPCLTLSYGSLYARSATLAKELQTRLSPGDRALLLFPASLEFVVSYFACLMADIVAVPLMPPRRNSSHDASAAIIADCQPRLALTLPEDALPGTMLRARLEEARVPQIGVGSSSELAQSPSLEKGRSDIAFLQYTSGSTSLPKGVMVSHGNLVDNLEMIRARLGNHAGSTHVGWIPHYHDMGLIMNLLQPIYLGARSVIMKPAGFMLRPLNWLRAIQNHEAEVAAAPNFAYDLCVERFRPDQMEGVDLSGWKVAVNGAEPVRAATLARFAKTFAPYGFDANAMQPSYGLAEATLMVTSAGRGAPVRKRTVSAAGLHRGLITNPERTDDAREIVGCGSPVDGVSVAIVNPDTLAKAQPAEIGEIWVQGNSVAQGYWCRPQESASVFEAQIKSLFADEALQKGNWLRTGDLGHLDDDGELYVIGRMKDLLIIRGVNHYPQDIEMTVAESHPALPRDHGAVFGFIDEGGTERVVVVHEVARSQRRTASRDIIAAVRAAVVHNHDLAFHEVVLVQPGSIPKTTSGKIQRSLTRQRWVDKTLELWAD